MFGYYFNFIYFSYKEGHRMLVPPKQNNQTNPSWVMLSIDIDIPFL